MQLKDPKSGHFSNSTWLLQTTLLTGNPSFRQKTVPFALHGDGTPCTGIGKNGAGSSPLGVGILSWSWFFKWLQLGTWPTEDHKGNKYPVNSEAVKKGGTALADGYCSLLWSLVGDLEYLTQALKLPHYGSKSSPCPMLSMSMQGWLFSKFMEGLQVGGTLARDAVEASRLEHLGAQVSL